MNKLLSYGPLFFVLLLIFSSCEKDVNINLPEAESKVVIEGTIENGEYPIILLTKSVGYFEPTDLNSIENMFVHDANVSITVDGIEYNLMEVCLSDLDSSLYPFIAEMMGIPVEQLASINYCAYSTFSLTGEIGKRYDLSVTVDSSTYTATTNIPVPVQLDSIWWQVQIQDSIGFIWANLTDPDTLGNAYRFFAKRISHFSDGTIKDEQFIPPFGSAFEDKFINGKSFEFAYDRGHSPAYDHSDERTSEVSHYYKVGDTIVVKFCSIDMEIFRFLRSYETEIYNNGNPFAAPSTIPSNIQGGALGIWAGYGATFDTTVAEL